MRGSSHEPMHVFFDPDRRPFLLDSQMRWEVEPNAFLAWLSVVNGGTNSATTWRSYAYQLADWFSFCERIGLAWRHTTELNIASYRNVLAAEVSSLSHRQSPQAEHRQLQIDRDLSVLQVRPQEGLDRRTSVRTGGGSNSLQCPGRLQSTGQAEFGFA